MSTDWKKLRKTYCEEGFVIAKGIIPSEVVDQVQNDINALCSLQLKRFGKEIHEQGDAGSLFANIKTLFDQDLDAYLGTVRRAAKLLSLHRLFLHETLIEGVRKIADCKVVTVSTEPIIHVMSDQLRMPGGYFGFDMHQDWPSIQGSLDVVVAWAPILPVTLQNYPLKIVPGSHRMGLLEGEVVGNAMSLNEGLYNPDTEVIAEVEPGDVIYFTGFTLHQTVVEGCSGFRLGASARFENASEPTFVQRNFPCAYQRTVHRDLFVEDFPDKHQVNALFALQD